MLGQQFYHETIRNVIVAFGTMFNNVQIVRKNNSGVVTQSMKVPLASEIFNSFGSRPIFD